jgi:U1 small nuclear ribonucleoprotein
MTAFLPPSLLALFAPREPLIYFPPLDELPLDKKPWPYNGVAQFLAEFEDPTETPVPTRGETKDERRARKRAEREERYRNNLDAQIKSCN